MRNVVVSSIQEKTAQTRITVDQGGVLRVNLVQLYIFRISPSSVAKEDNKITKITGKNKTMIIPGPDLRKIKFVVACLLCS